MREINQIAKDIMLDWKLISPYAKPYLMAMQYLTDMNSMYGADSAANILSYFLSNATTWKGEKAREIKKEINLMLKQYYRKNEAKQIKKVLQLLENSITGENVIELDTSEKRENSKGQVVYGGESDDELTYNVNEKHFSCYIHALTGRPGKVIKVKNKQTGSIMTFNLTKIDMDSSQEDTHGWNYECTTPKGKFTLLIIND